MGGLLAIILIVSAFLIAHAVPAGPVAGRGVEPRKIDAEQMRREEGVRRCFALKGWKGVARLDPEEGYQGCD
jgi:hypothetical protein